MSLERPTLDDRTYADLMEQMRDRIPIHSESWTDHNVHDPGITILEMLAWLAESYSYRLDRETDAHLRKYLSLVGVEPRQPSPANVRLVVDTPGTAADHVLPVGTRLVPTSGETDNRFTTSEPIRLTGAAIERVIVSHDRGRIDQTSANASADRQFHAFGEHATAGSALYLGLRGDPFDMDGDPNPLDIHLAVDETGLPPPASHGNCPVEFDPSIMVSWEYCLNHAKWFDDKAWAPFEVLADRSDSLYRPGTVRLAPPERTWDRAGAADVRVLDTTPGPAWIRCRLEIAGYEIPPRLERVALNVVSAVQTTNHGPARLAPVADYGETTSARPHQRFAFPDDPILDASIVVETADSDQKRWTEVPDFDAVGPEGRCYVRDATEGWIQFGDGRRGAIPPAGATVLATEYTVGGGSEGNVGFANEWQVETIPEDSDGTPVPTDVRSLTGTNLTPLGAAIGGADAESTVSAIRRARRDRNSPTRCVSAADYEAVAASTPGLRVGRTAAWVADTDTPDPTTHVVVIPYTVADSRPKPSSGFLAAVRRHVERHRLVGERVIVDPPTYIDIQASVTVRAAAGYEVATVESAVADALDEFLDPLSGFKGDGWPFGRPVYQSELYDVVADVDGVTRINNVVIRSTGTNADTAEGAVSLPPSALVAPGNHAVTVQTDKGWSS